MEKYTQVQLGRFTWDVFFVDEDHPKLENAYGAVYKSNLEIYLSADIPDQLLRSTIIHELTHASVWTYGFENISIRGYEEEDLCNFMEAYSEEILRIADDLFAELENYKDEEEEDYEED